MEIGQPGRKITSIFACGAGDKGSIGYQDLQYSAGVSRKKSKFREDLLDLEEVCCWILLGRKPDLKEAIRGS